MQLDRCELRAAAAGVLTGIVHSTSRGSKGARNAIGSSCGNGGASGLHAVTWALHRQQKMTHELCALLYLLLYDFWVCDYVHAWHFFSSKIISLSFFFFLQQGANQTAAVEVHLERVVRQLTVISAQLKEKVANAYSHLFILLQHPLAHHSQRKVINSHTTIALHRRIVSNCDRGLVSIWALTFCFSLSSSSSFLKKKAHMDVRAIYEHNVNSNNITTIAAATATRRRWIHFNFCAVTNG